MFGASTQPRTQAELLALANEMAQRIAYDVREWSAMKAVALFTGPGVVDPPPAVGVSRFAMPSNYQRMLLTSQVYPSWSTRLPLCFVSDTDEWLFRRLNGEVDSWGEWTLIGNDMLIYPVVETGKAVTFAYLDKNCIELRAPNGTLNGYGDLFTADTDTFRLPERLLKLGMLWQWKANKGSPYAEDMGTYSDALVMLAGSNTPAPIIIGHGQRRLVNAGYVQQS
jgi:hypothetical protein